MTNKRSTWAALLVALMSMLVSTACSQSFEDALLEASGDAVMAAGDERRASRDVEVEDDLEPDDPAPVAGTTDILLAIAEIRGSSNSNVAAIEAMSETLRAHIDNPEGEGLTVEQVETMLREAIDANPAAAATIGQQQAPPIYTGRSQEFEGYEHARDVFTVGGECAFCLNHGMDRPTQPCRWIGWVYYCGPGQLLKPCPPPKPGDPATATAQPATAEPTATDVPDKGDAEIVLKNKTVCLGDEAEVEFDYSNAYDVEWKHGSGAWQSLPDARGRSRTETEEFTPPGNQTVRLRGRWERNGNRWSRRVTQWTQNCETATVVPPTSTPIVIDDGSASVKLTEDALCYGDRAEATFEWSAAYKLEYKLDSGAWKDFGGRSSPVVVRWTPEIGAHTIKLRGKWSVDDTAFEADPAILIVRDCSTPPTATDVPPGTATRTPKPTHKPPDTPEPPDIGVGLPFLQIRNIDLGDCHSWVLAQFWNGSDINTTIFSVTEPGKNLDVEKSGWEIKGTMWFARGSEAQIVAYVTDMAAKKRARGDVIAALVWAGDSLPAGFEEPGTQGGWELTEEDHPCGGTSDPGPCDPPSWNLPVQFEDDLSFKNTGDDIVNVQAWDANNDDGLVVVNATLEEGAEIAADKAQQGSAHSANGCLEPLRERVFIMAEEHEERDRPDDPADPYSFSRIWLGCEATPAGWADDESDSNWPAGWTIVSRPDC